MKDETKQKIKEAIQMILISGLCTAFVLSLHGGHQNKVKEKTRTMNKIIVDSVKQNIR